MDNNIEGVILQKDQVDKLITSLEVSSLESIGSKEWFKRREDVIKLYQMAMLQAKSGNQDEVVKTSVAENNKIDYFVNELIIMSVWKEKIYPILMKMSPEPLHTFPTYLVLYHEAMIVGLLQLLMFHKEITLQLKSSTLDLIDYSIHQMARLDSSQPPQTTEDLKSEERSSFDIIKFQEQLISDGIAAQCLSMLRYIVENLEDMPLAVTRAMYCQHDLPVFITECLTGGLWSRFRNDILWKFHDTSWRPWHNRDPALSSTECQAWLLIYQLLTHPHCSTSYELTIARRERLGKLTGLLNERVTDMLSPLNDLKRILNHSLLTSGQSKATDLPLILEMGESYRDSIYSKYEGQYTLLAERSSKLLFYASPDDIRHMAVTMAYQFSKMDEVSDALRTCHNCFMRATKKCSRCRQVWYCSRECQIQHWPAHKNACN